jgi:signal transduction histidine kinase
MAKMIIERNMEGTISADNIESGARFTLSIPLEKAS